MYACPCFVIINVFPKLLSQFQLNALDEPNNNAAHLTLKYFHVVFNNMQGNSLQQHGFISVCKVNKECLHFRAAIINAILKTKLIKRYLKNLSITNYYIDLVSVANIGIRVTIPFTFSEEVTESQLYGNLRRSITSSASRSL